MIDFSNYNQEEEFRVLTGKQRASLPAPLPEAPKKKEKRDLQPLLLRIVLAVSIVVIVILIFLTATLHREAALLSPEPGIYDSPDSNILACQAKEKPAFLGDYSDTTGLSFTEYQTLTVDDIPFDIYIPHNAVPELVIGTPKLNDASIILAAQAADLRADNGKIVGAFVLKGEPLTWGLSKKGYVSIIDGKVTIGYSENSPLFEQATERGGYFFRQYPIVSNGSIVENEPKGKAVPKAICDRAGEIFIVVTQTPESFHDFSQALVDMGVDNAVYVVGSQYSYGFWRDGKGFVSELANRRNSQYRYENYIVWRTK